jgi:hypothetical protein
MSTDRTSRYQLLILHGLNRSRLRAEIDERFHIVQEISTYVVEVSGNPNAIRQFVKNSKEGIRLASDLATQDPTVVDIELTPAEHLFVEAWRKRLKRLKNKRRVGEGLPWNAPGFKPP